MPEGCINTQIGSDTSVVRSRLDANHKTQHAMSKCKAHGITKDRTDTQPTATMKILQLNGCRAPPINEQAPTVPTAINLDPAQREMETPSEFLSLSSNSGTDLTQIESILSRTNNSTPNPILSTASTVSRSHLHTASANGVLSVMLIGIIHHRRSNHTKTNSKPKYRRLSLLKHVNATSNTPWQRIMTFGTGSDFLVSINITKQLLVEKLRHQFGLHRKYVNYGGPYRKTNSKRGQVSTLQSIDLVGRALWYLKSRDPIHKLCPIFGIIPSSIYVWLEYALEVLLKVVTNSSLPEYEIRWPTCFRTPHAVGRSRTCRRRPPSSLSNARRTAVPR